MSSVVDTILGLSGALAYGLVALLAWAESGLLVGLVLPGEASVMLGGVLASRGNVSLPGMIAVAALAAAAGDLTGYWIGRRFLRRMLNWQWFDRRASPKLDRARAYLDSKGGRAVFFGRWIGVMRAFMPPLAGMSRMDFKQFAGFAVPAAIVWATTFVVIGYFAGASFRRLEEVIGRATVVIVVLVVSILLIRAATRAAINRRERVIRLWRRTQETPAIRWLRGRYGGELRWLGRRVDPNLPQGLRLTLALVILGAVTVAVGAIFELAIDEQETIALDRSVADWFRRHRTDPALDAAQAVLVPFVPPAAPITIAGATLLVGHLRSWGSAVRTAIGLLGALGLALAIQQIGLAGRDQFPAVGPALAAALAVSVAALAGSARGWVTGARAGGTGAAVVVVCGVATLVTQESGLMGVLAGAAVGALCAMILEVQRIGTEARRGT